MRDGKAEILVLSDREAHPDGLGGEAATQAAAAGRTAEMTFIPPMVAVGAVHHHLIQVGLRMDTSIIAETAQVRPTPRPHPLPHPHTEPALTLTLPSPSP